MSDTVHRDVVDAAAVALQRARKAAQDRGDKPLSAAAAAKNMRAFGTAMEEGTGSPALRSRNRYGTDPRQLGGFSGPGRSARDPRPLSSVVAGLPLREMQYNGVAEKFVPADATWEATEDRNTPGLYRINHHHKTRYVFRTAEDVESGHGRQVSSGLGKHLAARELGTALVSHDPELRLLSVPIGAALPGLYARAAVLCSGLLPTLVDEDFSLNYGDVSEEFASALVAKLLG